MQHRPEADQTGRRLLNVHVNKCLRKTADTDTSVGQKRTSSLLKTLGPLKMLFEDGRIREHVGIEL